MLLALFSSLLMMLMSAFPFLTLSSAIFLLLFNIIPSILFNLTVFISCVLVILYYVTRFPSSPSLKHWEGVVMGHRGCRTNLNIPENSLLAFEYAYEHGADAIELDCSLTKDGRIVCMHDNTVDRTCNGTGYVCDLTFDEIQQLSFKRTGKKLPESEPVEPLIDKKKRWNAPITPTAKSASSSPSQTPSSLAQTFNSYNFITETTDTSDGGDAWSPSLAWPSVLLSTESVNSPPSLENVILFAQARNLKIMIELKEYHQPYRIFQSLLLLYQKYPYLYQHSYIATFNPYHLYHLRRLSLSLPVCLLYCRDCLEWYHHDQSCEMQLPHLINYRLIRYIIDTILLYSSPTILLHWLNLSAIGPHNVLVTLEQTDWMRRQGIIMDIWCVNRTHELLLWQEEGCIVTTDYIFPKRSNNNNNNKTWNYSNSNSQNNSNNSSPILKLRKHSEYNESRDVDHEAVRLLKKEEQKEPIIVLPK